MAWFLLLLPRMLLKVVDRARQRCDFLFHLHIGWGVDVPSFPSGKIRDVESHRGAQACQHFLYRKRVRAGGIDEGNDISRSFRIAALPFRCKGEARTCCTSVAYPSLLLSVDPALWFSHSNLPPPE